MHRAAVSALLLLLSTLNGGCGPKITPQEAKVLVALEEIQRNVENDTDYDRFVQLLTTAKAELDMLRQSNDPNPCFLNAAEKCYASYEIARKAWQKKLEATDEKKKAEMEMTLAFSLSFSTLNIEKANNCYN